ILIFPEGTNLTPVTKEKSDEYALQHNVKPYEYCLHPRTTGFTYLLNTLRDGEIIDAVDDITVGYEGTYPLDEKEFFGGVIPKTVHFHCKRYRVSSLPNENTEIGEWLQTRWNEKEVQLHK
ncbi:unnamed protein product, partial [Didymodactylos carnosus]